MLSRLRLATASLLAITIVSIGCSSNNKEFPAQVSGKVTYKGAPVTGGIITLFSADGSPFQAPISNLGTYLFPNLPIGQVTVAIDTESINPDTMKKEDYKGGKAGAGGSGAMSGMYKKGGGAPAPSLKKGQENTKSPVPDGAQTGEVAYVKIPGKYKAKGTSGLTMDLVAGKQSKDFELVD